jgi:predicted RNase H-like nuclease (RuvC/YqgF family)
VPWWTWIALGVFALSLMAVAIFAASALARLKRLSTTGEAITGRLDELSRRAEELERRLEHANKRVDGAQRHVEHLEGSLERLGVLSWALGDARKSVARLRQAYLRK